MRLLARFRWSKPTSMTDDLKARIEADALARGWTKMRCAACSLGDPMTCETCEGVGLLLDRADEGTLSYEEYATLYGVR
jgi:hypothetical protein